MSIEFNQSFLKKEYVNDVLVQSICFLFILLFTHAAVSKLLELENFRIQLEQSPFLGVFAEWLVWAIPAVETLTAFLFFSPRLRMTALYASLGLMLMFTAYIFAVLNFADAIPCSCGGVIGSLSWNQHMFFNGAFVLLAATGIGLLRKT